MSSVRFYGVRLVGRHGPEPSWIHILANRTGLLIWLIIILHFLFQIPDITSQRIKGTLVFSFSGLVVFSRLVVVALA